MSYPIGKSNFGAPISSIQVQCIAKSSVLCFLYSLLKFKLDLSSGEQSRSIFNNHCDYRINLQAVSGLYRLFCPSLPPNVDPSVIAVNSLSAVAPQSLCILKHPPVYYIYNKVFLRVYLYNRPLPSIPHILKYLLLFLRRGFIK